MGVTRKQSMPNFPKNEHFLPLDQGGTKCLIFWKFSVLCFLVIPVLRFALLPYYRRTIVSDLSTGILKAMIRLGIS